jgi:hypothetical protein
MVRFTLLLGALARAGAAPRSKEQAPRRLLSTIPATPDLRQQVLTATTGDTFVLAAGTTYAWGLPVGIGYCNQCPSTSSAAGITLQGAGAGSSILDGATNLELFFVVYTTGTLVLKDLTIANANSPSSGAIEMFGGTLTLERCAFLKNTGKVRPLRAGWLRAATPPPPQLTRAAPTRLLPALCSMPGRCCYLPTVQRAHRISLSTAALSKATRVARCVCCVPTARRTCRRRRN